MTTMRFFLISLASLVACCCHADERPNFVVLFADDGGYADFGFQSNVRPDMARLTPHIDTIAERGAIFTQAYVTSSVCSPSRAGLMTGRYQQRFGHDANLPPAHPSGLPLTETFGAKRLQSEGYQTALIGKWHLGYPEEYQPNQRGFDHFHGLLQGSRSYFPYDEPSAHRQLRRNNTLLPEQGYITDRLGDAACEYIESHKTEPFFLFVSFTAPHGPLEPRKGYAKEERLGHIDDAKRKKYAGLIAALDDNVGKVLSALTENGLEDNTLVIFTNDNGGPGPDKTGASNFPLKGFKGSLDEGGIRVPWAMRFPGVVVPGTVIDQPVITLDIIPTLLDFAGRTIDREWRLDGLSLRPVMEDPQSLLPERTFYWRRNGPGGVIAMRHRDWKLIYSRKEQNPTPQLYDLAKDVGEANDLAPLYPDLVVRLQAMLENWESEMTVPLWRSNYGESRNDE